MQCIAVLCIFLVGCTVTIEPIQKKPTVTHRTTKKKKKIRPKETPTPAPKRDNKQPLQLQPTDRPTPIIKVDQITRLNISTDPLI